MSNGKFALAADPQQAEKVAEINKAVSKKLFGRQKPKKALVDPLEATGFDILVVAFMKVFMIVPSIVIGIMSAIGAFFEVGLKETLKTYRGEQP
jgi:ABC-type antimicrobial peptide transport system permease subunit